MRVVDRAGDMEFRIMSLPKVGLNTNASLMALPFMMSFPLPTCVWLAPGRKPIVELDIAAISGRALRIELAPMAAPLV